MSEFFLSPNKKIKYNELKIIDNNYENNENYLDFENNFENKVKCFN